MVKNNLILPAALPEDLESVERLARAAFSSSPDAELNSWFSFPEMCNSIQRGHGICLKAVTTSGEIAGIVYAQQESPINGPEGTEKWVIAMAAVLPEWTGQGIGSELLAQMERQAAGAGAGKMFVFTNEGDERVIRFYKRNGYRPAGRIRDYQYGRDNSAVFLLKYLE